MDAELGLRHPGDRRLRVILLVNLSEDLIWSVPGGDDRVLPDGDPAASELPESARPSSGVSW